MLVFDCQKMLDISAVTTINQSDLCLELLNDLKNQNKSGEYFKENS